VLGELVLDGGVGGGVAWLLTTEECWSKGNVRQYQCEQARNPRTAK
jgi:hypothetical protein